MPGGMAIYETQMRHRAMPGLWLAMSSWWRLAAEAVTTSMRSDQESVTHACELETSMILRLRPELVRIAVARGATIPFESAFYTPDFHRSSRVEVARTFEQLSVTGAFGHPEVASADAGEALFTAAATEIVAFVREFATWPTIEPS